MKIFLVEVPKTRLTIAFSEHSLKMWDQMQSRLQDTLSPSSLSFQEKLIKRKNH
jgi:hypothetical protein